MAKRLNSRVKGKYPKGPKGKRDKGKVNGNWLNRMMRKCKITGARDLTLTELMVKQHEAEVLFDYACTRSEELTERFLDGLAESRAEANGTTKETELKQMKQIKKQRNTSQTLRRVLQTHQKGLATKLFVTVDDVEIAVEDQEGIVDASIEENEKRFDRCIACSFLQEPLLSEVGMLCEGPAVDQILNGTYETPPDLEEYVDMVLKEMKISDTIAANPMGKPVLTPEDNKEGWKKQRQHTAVDPRSLNFAHHKAATFDPELNRIDTVLRELPMKHGFAPEAWNPMADCSIPKKLTILQAAKKRTICLMNALYNMNNKWFGRWFMGHNEDLGTLADEQAGARKN